MTFLSDAPLAQLDRALDFGSSGRGFESLRARQKFKGVAVIAAAPFSLDCEVIVKFACGMTSYAMYGEIELPQSSSTATLRCAHRTDQWSLHRFCQAEEDHCAVAAEAGG